MDYIDDGDLCIDNNMAETCMRLFVLAHKNWLFSRTSEEAEASALLYSLIESAKANSLEPYAYLRHVFKKVPMAVTIEDVEAWLPWNISSETLALVQP